MLRQGYGEVDIRSRITLAGTKPPPPVFNKDKRKHLIHVLFEAMSDWRYSPFQYEGATRNQLRSALCAAGYDWQRADHEAASLVAEVLKGYPRPSWNEGQPSYTASIVTCKGCGGPLGEYEISNGIRYCCEDCRKMSRYKVSGLNNGSLQTGPKKCENPACQKVFYPVNHFVQYCCRACHVEAQKIFLPTRNCDFCGKEFQPSQTQSLYCTQICKSRAAYARKRATQLEDRQDAKCLFCGGYFTPKKLGAQYCGKKHMKAAAYAREKAAKAAATNPDSPIGKLFDQAA